MATNKPSELVLVFDLDDTLYQEFDYQNSGIAFVGQQLHALYGVDIKDKLLQWRDSGHIDLWQKAAQLLELPESVAEQMLWMYRLHVPKIELPSEVSDILFILRSLVGNIVILTDGRSISQRLKLSVLGLLDLPFYISEEHQSQKPCQKRFIAIMGDYHAKSYVYIGDNPKKDFLAPNQLGWKTIGLVNPYSVHSQQYNHLSGLHHPNTWIRSWHDLLPIINGYLD
jgi:putative hydrolase of the HAD superfamily